jgi:hypothetical protein|tara:strand:- start:4793 stop:5689 length:897 start_codon:yes stop_codon:yes gene_type:complete
MNIKIVQHLMPWELDYALLSFTQLKKSKYYLSGEDNITIETCLNLSSHIINWNESKLPKEYFLEKYNEISKLLVDYNHVKKVYKDNQLYGHLDLQREATSPEIDYYMYICPDMYFSEHLLSLVIEGAKQVKNKHFIITPQIPRLWDDTWEVLMNPQYQKVDYNDWDNQDTFDIIHNDTNSKENIQLTPISNFKFAGWFDLYSKSFWEDLVPVWDEWKGYGSWDWYSMVVSEHFKAKGGDIQQYILKGKTIFEYPVGNLKEGGFHSYYKNNLTLNDIKDQRDGFKSNVPKYVRHRVNQL